MAVKEKENAIYHVHLPPIYDNIQQGPNLISHLNTIIMICVCVVVYPSRSIYSINQMEHAEINYISGHNRCSLQAGVIIRLSRSQLYVCHLCYSLCNINEQCICTYIQYIPDEHMQNAHVLNHAKSHTCRNFCQVTPPYTHKYTYIHKHTCLRALPGDGEQLPSVNVAGSVLTCRRRRERLAGENVGQSFCSTAFVRKRPKLGPL